jgi:hypothetical protein
MEEVKGKLEWVGRLQNKLDEREREVGRLRMEVERLRSEVIVRQTELEYASRGAQRGDEELELSLYEL